MLKYGLILVAMAVLTAGAVGTAGAATAASPDAFAGASGAAVISKTSGGHAVRQKAKRKALRKCRKIDKRSRRKACVKRVRKRFSTGTRVPPVVSPPAAPPAAVIDVRDKYFNPDVVDVKAGDSILWSWNGVNRDPHNVTLTDGPPGVDRGDFTSPATGAVGLSMQRTFTVPGTYQFVCTLHFRMTMQVTVTK